MAKRKPRNFVGSRRKNPRKKKTGPKHQQQYEEVAQQCKDVHLDHAYCLVIKTSSIKPTAESVNEKNDVAAISTPGSVEN